MNRFLWILDAGHGIDTKGKRSPIWEDGTQLLEWKFNRLVVNRLALILQEQNIAHYILVPEDKDISLPDRCHRANELPSDLPKIVVSIHGNAAGIVTAKGYEVFTSPNRTKSDDIATVFHNKAGEHTNLKLRADYSDGDPDKESKFYILIHTKMPAILTENGFFTNEKESKEMMTKEYQDMIAKAHFEAIIHIEKHGA